MEIQGLVTDINPNMLTFTIDGKTTVHAVLLFANNPSQKLPRKGTKVSVDSEFYKSNEFYTETLVLCYGTEIQGDLAITCPQPNKFQQFVKNRAVKASDLLIIAENYRKLNRQFRSPHGIGNDEIMLCTMAALLNGTREVAKVTLKFISEMGYVDPPGPNNVYKDLEYWTFGAHWDRSERPNRNYLIGFLYAHRKYGCVCFTDFKRTVDCTIIFNSDIDVLDVVNKYVLIENYTFLTEIFNCKTQPYVSKEYLLVRSRSIKVLSLDDRSFRQNIILKEAPKDCDGYEKPLRCKIITKSSAMINREGSLELWLEVLMEDGNKVLFRLNSTYTEIFPLLKVDFTYKIMFKKDATLKRCSNAEMKKITSLQQLELPPGCIFVPLAADSSHVMGVDAANQNLASSDTSLVSFQGRITLKKFITPLHSYTNSYTTDPNFGTPGSETHLLQFAVGPTGTMTLYLNNFENLITPNCLVPNMSIRAYNVLPQRGSSRYYKCTIMTSCEVASYDCEFAFDTANLRGGLGNADWGAPCWLGASARLPVGVIVWSRIEGFYIFNLEIEYHSDRQLLANITILTQDQKGESKVIANNRSGIALLKLLLRGAQKPLLRKWCEGAKALKHYKYSRGARDQGNGKEAEANNALTAHFDSISNFKMNLELKCRKVGNTGIDRKNRVKSIFSLLDARK